MEKTLTLRIKKVFLKKILNGEKNGEYRKDSEFYRKLFKGKKYNILILHYQKSERLKVQIKSIRLIKTPKAIKESPYIGTNKCYFINLGDIISHQI